MPRWGRCDFEDLKKFQEKLDKITNADTQKFIEDTVKEIASRLLAKVIPRTPVGVKPYDVDDKVIEKYWTGYVGGTLRRGWVARTEQEAENGKGKTVSQERIKNYVNNLRVNKQGNNYVIIVENPVKYGIYVEYGHRQEIGRYVPQLGKKLKQGWVDGKLMLTISEKELNGQLDKIVEQKLSEFLGECFKNG